MGDHVERNGRHGIRERGLGNGVPAVKRPSPKPHITDSDVLGCKDIKTILKMFTSSKI